MLPDVSILGTRVLRIEDPKFLTTGGVYTGDLRDPRLTGAAHVTYVRSVMAHARITFDAPAAREHPGVLAVFTAGDIADVDPPPPVIGLIPAALVRPWLARDVVRYVGEPLAAIVTEQLYDGEDAAELVFVDYDPLSVVVDPREAATDATVLHSEHGSNVAFATDFGEVDTLFDGCEVVVRQEVVNQRVSPAPLEVRSSACAWGEDGRLVFWGSTQNPHGARD